ncbi:MAG: UDP-galactopyranose mutase [Actinomycetota bacterium]|jgi:glycosyltransferase involved in cell wall biosynthesis
MPALRLSVAPDLVVLSHLRWDFVWQRPQHLISRVAATGRRTWFVEEPVLVPDAQEVTVRELDAGAVTRLWLEIPGEPRHCGFGDPVAVEHQQLIADYLGRSSDRVCWLYTPMAMPIATALDADLVVYDVMDDLASFAHAPEGLRALQMETLERADLVFTGGRSLHRGVVDLRGDAHCFPSGVEPEHYARARGCREVRDTPVAGYVGVIDERLDLDLIGGLARALPDWEIHIVGPVVKIDPASLPQAPNLHYPGPVQYDELPECMAKFDVALMPFALNEATRSISPTKTLEYLAAGLPVVSTSVPDVVASFSDVVDIQDDTRGFAAACREVLAHDARDRDRKLRPLLHANHWDTIAARMTQLIETARRPLTAARPA